MQLTHLPQLNLPDIIVRYILEQLGILFSGLAGIHVQPDYDSLVLILEIRDHPSGIDLRIDDIVSGVGKEMLFLGEYASFAFNPVTVLHNEKQNQTGKYYGSSKDHHSGRRNCKAGSSGKK